MNWLQKNLDNRRVFINTLTSLAEKDDKVCLIIADVGFNYIDDFKERFPNRFWNIGVTEPSAIAQASRISF